PLLEPRDGLPPLVTTARALAEAVAALGAGEGPVAVDAERASGYRYGHRAFLVQFRRRAAGTVLIDPVSCPDLSALDAALVGCEAVLHAASQDLPCLAELGYRPRRLFDTELAGRLLGYPRACCPAASAISPSSRVSRTGAHGGTPRSGGGRSTGHAPRPSRTCPARPPPHRRALRPRTAGRSGTPQPPSGWQSCAPWSRRS